MEGLLEKKLVQEVCIMLQCPGKGSHYIFYVWDTNPPSPEIDKFQTQLSVVNWGEVVSTDVNRTVAHGPNPGTAVRNLDALIKEKYNLDEELVIKAGMDMLYSATEAMLRAVYQ